MEQPKNRRNRRTRAELEADVFDAVRQLASEKGLAQISFTDIMQRAGILSFRERSEEFIFYFRNIFCGLREKFYICNQ